MPFTLFITYNVRHRVHVAVAQEIENLRGQLAPNGNAIMDWYANAAQPEALRIKAIVPSVVSQAASNAQLDCRVYPPIRYVGHQSATMVHFAFDLTPRADAFRGHTRDARGLVTLPLIEVIDGALGISPQQDPAFNRNACTAELGFLPAPVRDAILG
jgi:hypothetical protein